MFATVERQPGNARRTRTIRGVWRFINEEIQEINIAITAFNMEYIFFSINNEANGKEGSAEEWPVSGDVGLVIFMLDRESCSRKHTSPILCAILNKSSDSTFI